MGRIDRISYQKTFNIGSYQSERIGVEIELNSGEDAKEALSTAKSLVHEFYMEGIPQQIETHSVVADNIIVPIVDIKADEPPPTKLTKEEQQRKYLTDCTTIEELNTFKLLVKNNPHLQECFDNHLNKLTNGL